MKTTNKRMDGVQMEITSGWGMLSLRRVVGFGGRVCGEKPSTNETTSKRMDDVQMDVASGWVGLSMRRVVGFGGRVCGGKPSTNETTNSRMDDVQMGVVSTSSNQRLRGGGGCPCGGLWVSAGVSVGWGGGQRMGSG